MSSLRNVPPFNAYEGDEQTSAAPVEVESQRARVTVTVLHAVDPAAVARDIARRLDWKGAI